MMRGEGGEAGVGKVADADAVFAGEALHELTGEVRDVLHAFAQGRDVNGHHVKAEEQVLAELLALDAFLEMPVGGGDDANIHLDRAVAADAFQFAFLQDAQELGLDLRRDFADFVQKNGAVVGKLETAFAFGDGAGERAFLMAKKFAFDKIFRNGGAIELDEGGAGALALTIEGAGDKFLAGAAFAGDEDGGLGGGDLADQFAKLLHRSALAEEFVTAFLLLGMAQILVDLEQLAEILGLLQGDFQLVVGKGLEHVIEGAVAHAFDGGLHGTEAETMTTSGWGD